MQVKRHVSEAKNRLEQKEDCFLHGSNLKEINEVPSGPTKKEIVDLSSGGGAMNPYA
jgi:hypothetical protein